MSKNKEATLEKSPKAPTPTPSTLALDFLVEVASMRIAPVIDKKRMGISVVNRWSPLAQAMTITGKARVSPEAIGNPIRLKVDENGAPQFTAKGMPKTEINPEIKVVADGMLKGIDAYILQATNEARFANTAEWSALSEQARKAGQDARKTEVRVLTEYAKSMQGAKS